MNSRSRDLDPLAIAQLTLDTAPYLSCDDCFEQVDAHVDALLSGAAEILTPDFRAHLIGCAACRDEARSLIDLAGQDLGVDRETVLSRFERALASPGRPSL
jgi:hypothetical protein